MYNLFNKANKSICCRNEILTSIADFFLTLLFSWLFLFFAHIVSIIMTHNCNAIKAEWYAENVAAHS